MRGMNRCGLTAALALFAGTLFVTLPVTAQEQAPVYAGLEDDAFLTRWLLLGPIDVFDGAPRGDDEAAQRAAFAFDHITPEAAAAATDGTEMILGDTVLSWQLLESTTDTVDFDRLFGAIDYVAAYAVAHVDVPQGQTRLMAIGSDDAVRVWVNGQLVHEMYQGRAVVADNDLFQVSFEPGRNVILVKVQDMQLDWGFMLRPLGPNAMTPRLVDAASRGVIDEIKLLLGMGADVNGRTELGLAPIDAARIAGREQTVRHLVEYGADPSRPVPPAGVLVAAALADATEGEQPGAAVLVARDGQILYHGGFGYADLENEVRITEETAFRIGSITKQFVAAAILRLREEGKISLEDPLKKFFPDFPRGDSVSVYQLLTHTSGIHSFTNTQRLLQYVTSPISSEALIDTIVAYGYDFDPGKAFAYNNSGYFLLGQIIERVTGLSWGDYLAHAFFEPLGMHHTGVHTRDATIELEAKGYSYEGAEPVPAIDWDMTWAGGAGALYSTVGDLYRWNEAVFGGDVLNEESLQLAFKPALLKDGTVADANGSRYGFGWFIDEYRGQRRIAHSGGLHGFAAQLTRLPDLDATVVVLTNPTRVAPNVVADRLLDAYLWQELPPQESFETYALDPERYDDYVGRYAYPGGAVLTVTREGAHLYAQLTGQQRAEIFPSAEDAFFWKIVDAQVDFVRDATGSVIHAVHHQNSATFEAPRLANEVAIEVDPATLDRYTGDYQMGPSILSIVLEGGRLFAEATGQPRFELFARSETEFFLRDVNAAIRFELDGEGQATTAVINQAGVEMKAPRITKEL